MKPGKVPLLASWQNTAARKPVDETTIEEWWRKWPSGNLGVLLGPASGLLGLDVDRYRGFALLVQLINRDGRLPLAFTGHIFSTPNGGLRFLFRYRELDPRIVNHSFQSADGGEAIKVLGEGTQTVMPPSVLVMAPGVFRSYEWLPGISPTAPLPAFPQWLEAALVACIEAEETAKELPPVEGGKEGTTRRLGSGGSLASGSTHPEISRDERLERGRELVARWDERCHPEEDHPQDHTRVHIKLATWVAVGLDVCDDDAVELIGAWYTGSGGEGEIRRTITSARKRSHKPLGFLLDEPPKRDPTMHEKNGEPRHTAAGADVDERDPQGQAEERSTPQRGPSAAGGAKAGRVRRKPRSVAALMQMELPPVNWVIPDTIAAGLTLVAGRPKTCKSWLMLDVAIAVAAGQSVFGLAPGEPADVLYLGLEDSERRLQKRIGALYERRGIEVTPHGFVFETEWDRANEGGLDDIEAWITEVQRPRLVVIDTIPKFRSRAKHGRADVCEEDYEAMGIIKKLADKHNVAIGGVLHTSKKHEEDFLDAVAGTSAITGAADSVLVLSRQRLTPRGTLAITGRDVEAERKLELEWGGVDGPGWRYVGPAENGETPFATPAWDRLRHVLLTANRFCTIREMRDVLGLGEDATEGLRKLVGRKKKSGDLIIRGDSYALPEVAARVEKDLGEG